MRRNARTTTAVLTALAAVCAPTGAAAADDDDYQSVYGSEPAAALNCPDPLIEQPFTAFGDSRDYVLAPGGAFSDNAGGGWNLRGGARVDDGELNLREDSSARSPSMCVDLDYPEARFRYSVRARKADDAELRVEVRYPDGEDSGWEKVAEIDGDEGQDIGAGWKLSPDVPMRPELGGSEPGWRHVQIRLRSKDERWRIDDMYVDPKRRS